MNGQIAGAPGIAVATPVTETLQGALQGLARVEAAAERLHFVIEGHTGLAEAKNALVRPEQPGLRPIASDILTAISRIEGRLNEAVNKIRP